MEFILTRLSYVIFAAVILTGFITNSSPLNNSKNEEILKIMKQQEDCWNEGDLECFMKGYWKSDSLKFIGKKGITYGWGNTLERYRKNYPDKESMGTLKFEIKSPISPKTFSTLLDLNVG